MESMMKKFYFLVTNNLSPEEKGICCGKAAINYSYQFDDNCSDIDWHIFKGGFSNNQYHTSIFYENKYIKLVQNLNNDIESHIRLNSESGSMEANWNFFIGNDINASPYFEKNLNNSLVAIAFIVPEQVFNNFKYLPFLHWLYKIESSNLTGDEVNLIDKFYMGSNVENVKPLYKKVFDKWVDYMGSKENAYLKIFMEQFSII